MSNVNTHHFPLGDILVVDDNTSDLKFLSSILRKAGYTVRPASDGELALRSVQARLPAMILLDIRMPGLDGYEVCRRLKDSEDTRDIPVIFISVRTSPLDKVKAFGVGGVDYISKPFEPEEVLARVATHLALWKAQREIKEKNLQLQQEIVERVRAEERLEHLNLVLRAIRRVNQLITRERDRDCLLQDACESLIETRGYHNAWIALLDESGGLVTTTEAGLGEDFLLLVEQLKRSKLPTCGRTALSRSGVVVTEDPPSACADCPLAMHYGGRGAMTVRLEHGEKVYGLLSASIPAHLTADREEQALFREVARDIAFALHDIELEEERQRAEWALGERLKELTCLYAVSRDMQEELSIDELCRRAVEHLVPATQFPEITVPVIELDGKRFTSENYTEGLSHGLHAEIRVEGEAHGHLWVYYAEERPFLISEEQNLVNGVAEALSMWLERKRAEEELIRLSSAVKTSVDSIGIIDMEGKIVDVNEAAVKMYGTDDKGDLIGKHIFHFIAPEQRERALAGMEAILEKGYDRSRGYDIVTKDGSRVPVEMTAALMKGPDGKPMGLAVISRDITEQLQAEEALRESEERFRTIIEDTDAGYFRVDRDGRWQHINEAWLRMHGYDSPDEVIGKHFALTQVEADLEQAKRNVESLLSGAPIPTGEFSRRYKDGSIGYHTFSANPVVQGGEVVGLEGFIIDITERKRAEELLELERKRLSMLLETFPGYIYLQSPDYSVRYANQYFVEHFGEPKGRLCYEVLWGRKEPCEVCPTFEVFDTKTPQVWEWSQTPDGRVYVIYDHPFVDSDGSELVLEIGVDITERKRAEEELQRTLEKLREALGGIIQTVALTVEVKDPYTAGHQRRVANLARAIANEMGLSPEQTEGIRMAGAIHDLGKVGVPTEILGRPGPLNDLQFGLIKAHPQIGYDILKTVEFPWPVAQIVLQHHERLDGSGYPQGLSGEEIMLEARILAVADVVEAMASRRPYRPPRGLDKALEEISQNRGILYDPEVVDACLKLFTEKEFEFE